MNGFRAIDMERVCLVVARLDQDVTTRRVERLGQMAPMPLELVPHIAALHVRSSFDRAVMIQRCAGRPWRNRRRQQHA
jgi:hypothetical protein